MPVELSDAVERTDHVVSTDPHVVVRVHRPKGVDGAAAVHLLDPRRGLHPRHATTWTTPASTATARCSRASACRSSTGSRRRRPIPGPLEDCYAGLKWTYEHRDELGIDPERIGIAGISAGGGLAAALALLARDRAEVPLSFQLLECPMIDDRQVTSSSQLDGPPDLEPRLERVRLAQLPRRSLRHRRHPHLRRAGARHRPVRPADLRS